MSALDQATRFVRAHFANANAALLGGSVARGCDTPTSDLDIVIVYQDPHPNYAQTLRFEDRLVEAFVHTPTSIAAWNDAEAAARKPVLASLLATSITIVDAGLGRQAVEDARALLAQGPAPLDDAHLAEARYSLSAELDDLRGCCGGAEEYAIASDAFRSAATLLLLVERQWLGGGKWLVRHLADCADPAGGRLLAWAAGERNREDLCDIVASVLDKAGGYLQEGHLRGSR